MSIKDEFRTKAEALARIESRIMSTDEKAWSMYEPDWRATDQKMSLIIMAACAALIFISGIVMSLYDIFTDKNDMVVAVCGIIMIVSATKAYLEFSGYTYRRRVLKECDKLFEEVEKMKEARTTVLAALNTMRAENSELAGTYWWDTGIEPSYTVALQLPGKFIRPGDATFTGLVNQLVFSDLPDGIYMESYITHKVSVPPKAVEEMLNSDDMAVIFKSKRILSQEHEKFTVMQIYSIYMEALEEIKSSTVRVRIDKEEEMRAYREKLDSIERSMNFSEGYITEQEAALYGHRTAEDAIEYGNFRDTLEIEHKRKLDAQPDFEETTRYKQVIGNMWDYTFVTCAYVFLSENSSSNGEIALIVLPRKEQPVVHLTMRADNPEEPFCGYLEKYLGKDALTVGQRNIRPSIRMLTNYLTEDDGKDCLNQLVRCNILSSKPQNLEDSEWCYLVWKIMEARDS